MSPTTQNTTCGRSRSSLVVVAMSREQISTFIQQHLHQPNPKPFQVDAVRELFKSGRMLSLSQAPGAGKTTVIKAAAMASGGITCLIFPTITLGTFMESSFRKTFGLTRVVNLDLVKGDSAKKKLEQKFREMVDAAKKKKQRSDSNGPDRKQNTLIVLASPESLTVDKAKWCTVLLALARHKLLRMVVLDEAHLAYLHETFRGKQYTTIKKKLFKKLWELPLDARPRVAFVSATLRTETIKKLHKDWGNSAIQKGIRATPREIGRRDIKIKMQCRQPNAATLELKKLIPKLLAEPDGSKIAIFTNFKSHVERIKANVYDSVSTNKDLFIPTIDGDDEPIDKKAAILTFANLSTSASSGDDRLSNISRAAVISAQTGAEGYDCIKIRMVFRFGMPTSLEQLFQELGRVRVDTKGVYRYSDYYMYPCLQDYITLRHIWLTNREFTSSLKGYEFSVDRLHEVMEMITDRACWSVKLERTFGYGGDDINDSGDSYCGNCPYCLGITDSHYLHIDMKAFRRFLKQLFKEGKYELMAFVKELRLNAATCNKLYKSGQKKVQDRYLVEFLVMILIVKRIISIDHVQEPQQDPKAPKATKLLVGPAEIQTQSNPNTLTQDSDVTIKYSYEDENYEGWSSLISVEQHIEDEERRSANHRELWIRYDHCVRFRATCDERETKLGMKIRSFEGVCEVMQVHDGSWAKANGVKEGDMLCDGDSMGPTIYFIPYETYAEYLQVRPLRIVVVHVVEGEDDDGTSEE